MLKTQGFTHLHLAVKDIQRSVKFYTETLGMQVQFWEGRSMVFLHTPGSRDLLTLRQARRGEAVGMGGGLGHFGFRLRRKGDLDAAVEEVVAAGGKLLGRGEHAPGQHYAYLADPDGYVIEL